MANAFENYIYFISKNLPFYVDSNYVHCTVYFLLVIKYGIIISK